MSRIFYTKLRYPAKGVGYEGLNPKPLNPKPQNRLKHVPKAKPPGLTPLGAEWHPSTHQSHGASPPEKGPRWFTVFCLGFWDLGFRGYPYRGLGFWAYFEGPWI